MQIHYYYEVINVFNNFFLMIDYLRFSYSFGTHYCAECLDRLGKLLHPEIIDCSFNYL